MGSGKWQDKLAGVKLNVNKAINNITQRFAPDCGNLLNLDQMAVLDSTASLSLL